MLRKFLERAAAAITGIVAAGKLRNFPLATPRYPAGYGSLRRPLGNLLLASALVGASALNLPILGEEANPKGLPSQLELPISIQQSGSRFYVVAGTEPFTEVDIATYRKPICYPIWGPGQIPMTRNHPMQPGSPDEATDHPHHKSMWFAHGSVNSVSFWDEKGEIRFAGLQQLTPSSITFANNWVGPDGVTVCRDVTTLRFGARADVRWIDWDVVFHPQPDQPLVFGDTKEGMMALRSHPHLNLTNPSGGPLAGIVGNAMNSEGVRGTGIWGLRARWVHYWGAIANQPAGISIFDHPENLRHPTYWHARDYGLIAANPFGEHDFTGAGDGTYTLPANETLRFRYRFTFHAGETDRAKIERLYEEFR